MRRRSALALASALVGCGGGGEAPVGVRVRMDFADTASLYAAPFPSEHRRHADGSVSLEGYASGQPFVDAVAALVDGRARGFATTAGIYFALTGDVDPASLPTLAESVEPDAAAFVVAVDPEAPDYLARYPVTAGFAPDGGPFGAAHLLSLLPLQGIPLRPGQRYAAVVTTRARDVAGRPLMASDEVAAIAAGAALAGLGTRATGRYRQALAALADAGLDAARIAGLAVFDTWDPTVELAALTEAARPLGPNALLAPFALDESFDDFCVYAARVEVPVYQRGDAPYYDGGGDIVFADDGAPVLDHFEEARIVVTLPRAAMPAGGWPTVVMIRTGGGGDRPLVDRGVQAEPGGPAIEPGSGPAREFARVGFAGVSVDGPHGGIRNVTGGDEQFLMFNVSNPAALRDNVRQSAMEIALLPDLLAALVLDASGCPGTSPTARFDGEHLALLGHSMGATIAPLTLAVEPRYRVVVLSGAGGSWIENVVYKQSPLEVRPLIEVLLGYASQGYALGEHDPVLSLLQYAGEPADPPVYARLATSEPTGGAARNVLVFQGIVDTYILPPIANATNLSFGLDLAIPALDAESPELASFTPLAPLLAFSGGSERDLPVTGNRGATTAVVVQHPEDGVEDGHEVMFQTEGPKAQYRCLLSSWLAHGTPTVPDGAGGCE